MEKRKAKLMPSSNPRSPKVKLFAIISRLVVLFIHVLSNFVIPDHEPDVFQSPTDPELQVTNVDRFIHFFIGGLKRWDAQYFLHISQYGYTHENTLAFFPLFPILIRGFASVLYVGFQLFCNYHSCLLLASVSLNFYLFCRTSVYFYKLSHIVLKDEDMAYFSAILFCVNPASIFFSAPYSECLYFYLTCYALVAIEEKKQSLSTFAFSIASGCRSNGLVNAGFLIHSKMRDCVEYFRRLKNAKTDTGNLNLAVVIVLSLNYMLIPMMLQCVLTFLPFFIFQVWSYQTFCQEEGVTRDYPFHLEDFLKNNFLHTPDLGSTDWCDKKFPLPYASVQEKYWEVAPLRYYEMKQLPNFLLALPIVLLIISHAALYTVDNTQICYRLGIQPHITTEEEKTHWSKTGINSSKVFVYTVHALGLGVFCVLCIHIQVTTRLLCSSSPIVYWFAAYSMNDVTPESISKPTRRKSIKVASKSFLENFMDYFHITLPQNFWGQLVLTYFIFYFVIGNIMFSNFYPWT